MPTYNYWNPSDKHADITLTFSDQLASCSTANRRGVRSVDWNRDSKFYFELELVKINGEAFGYDCQFGIAASSVDLSDRPGADVGTPYFVMGIDENQLPDGRATFNSGTESAPANWLNLSASPWADGSIAMIAVDFEAGKIWFGVDGDWYLSGNPANGTSPTWQSSDLMSGIEYYVICSVIGGGDPTQVVLLSDPGDFAYTPPSGFQQGWFHPTHHEGIIQEDIGVSAAISTIKELSAEITASVGASGTELGLRDRSEISASVGVGELIEGDSPYREIEGSAGVGESIVALNTTSPISGTVALDESVVAQKEHHPSISEDTGIGEVVAAHLEYPVALSSSCGLNELFEGFNYSKFLRDNDGNISKRFYCTLSGSQDGETDLVFPISSLSARIRNDAPTFLSVVIPETLYLSEITARINGTITVDMAYLVGGVEQFRELLVRVDLEDIRQNRGGRNQSVSISGHKTELWTNKVVTLRNLTLMRTSNNKFYYEAEIDPYLRPGDTINAESNQFTCGLITYIINEEFFRMEVAEA